MSKQDLDIIFCNLPLVGFVIGLVFRFSGAEISEGMLAYLVWGIFVFGSLAGIVWGFVRVFQQKWGNGKRIVWSIGLLFFSQFSLPWLYWEYLRHQHED